MVIGRQGSMIVWKVKAGKRQATIPQTAEALNAGSGRKCMRVYRALGSRKAVMMLCVIICVYVLLSSILCLLLNCL